MIPRKLKKTQGEENDIPVDSIEIDDVEDLGTEELSGPSTTPNSTAYSDTDEDENEGLGDGKIGNNTSDLFEK